MSNRKRVQREPLSPLDFPGITHFPGGSDTHLAEAHGVKVWVTNVDKGANIAADIPGVGQPVHKVRNLRSTTDVQPKFGMLHYDHSIHFFEHPDTGKGVGIAVTEIRGHGTRAVGWLPLEGVIDTDDVDEGIVPPEWTK